MKQFVTAVAEANETEEDLEAGSPFEVDGVECRCFKPRDGQIAVLMAATGRHAREGDKVAAIINFFVNVLDDKSYQHIVGRLMDYSDEFGLKEVEQIMEWMVEEWSGNPTQSPSVSTASRKKTGRTSTPRTPAST